MSVALTEGVTMEERPGLRGMVNAHFDGLRRLNESSVRATHPTAVPVVLLYGPPVVVAAVAGVFQWDLKGVASALIGGFALMAAVLIAVFTQLAAWRDRLQDRAEKTWLSEAPARRAVDGAAVHALVGVTGSAASVLFAILLEAKVAGTVVWSACLAAAGTWMLGLLFLIVRSVYVGFESTASNVIRQADAQIMRGDVLRDDGPAPEHRVNGGPGASS